MKKHWRGAHSNTRCPHCDKDINIMFFDQHLSDMHKIATPRNSQKECTECDKKFCNNSLLKNHMDEVHIREPNYVCDICALATISRRKLISHKYEAHFRKHHSFKCNICNAAFRGVKPLKKHMLIVHLTKLDKTSKELIGGF